MNQLQIVVLFFLTVNAYQSRAEMQKNTTDTIPTLMKGHFTDDYKIHYTITDSLWVQHPSSRFKIIEWNAEEKFILARNMADNPSDGNLFTRIDYTFFKNMEPYSWGFCLSVYDAKTFEAAKSVAPADRLNPKTGCNGFPFSRMKKKSAKGVEN